MISKLLDKKIGQWVVLILLAFIWGSSFILMKKGLIAYTYDEIAALRMTISFICLLPFAIVRLKRVEKKYWKYLFMVGVFGNGIPAFLFTKAITQINHSLTGMLNSLTALFALIIGLLIFKIKFGKNGSIGVIIGLIGTFALLYNNEVSSSNSNIIYIGYVIIATICYAISVNVIKIYLQEIDSVTITAMAFFFMSPPIVIYLFTTNFISTTINHPYALTALFYISILSIAGTVIALIFFSELIKKTSTIFASSVVYLIPIVALFWGFIDNETIRASQIIGISVVLFGIYFINKEGK